MKSDHSPDIKSLRIGPLAALGNLTPNKKEVYETIYKEITKHLEENEIVGVQLYPSGWPRKLQITVNEKELKERLIIQGLDMFGKHVEFRDENSILKITVKDAPVEWTDGTLISIMEKYGEVVRVDNVVPRSSTRATKTNLEVRALWLNTTFHQGLPP